MEKYLQRQLQPNEHVHHLNHNTLDNRIENLVVLTGKEHTRHHLGLPEGRWSLQYATCQQCGMTERPHTAKGLCKACYQHKAYWANPEKARALARKYHHNSTNGSCSEP